MDEQLASFARLIGAIREEELRAVRTARRSLTECYVLQILALSALVTATELAERLALAKSTVSLAVDSLVKHGLVRRSGRGRDRRMVGLNLTRKGTEWVHRFWTEKAGLLLEAMAGLNTEERRVVADVMQRVAEVLEQRRRHAREGCLQQGRILPAQRDGASKRGAGMPVTRHSFRSSK